MSRTVTAKVARREPTEPRPKVDDVRYHVRPGYRVKAADAETIGRAILDLTGDGNASPAQIVKAARPPESPLHRFFEWDDRIAAERHRIARAQYLVGAIEIVISYEGGGRTQLRAFHSVTMGEGDEAERGYAGSGTVFGRKELREQIIAAARRELAGWTERYGRYESLAEEARMVTAVIRKLEEKAGA